MNTTTHDCRVELNAVDLRATPVRIALLQLFEKSEKPLDVSTLISYLEKKKIPADPATVFRIVNTFLDKGLVRQVQLQESKLRYELSNLSDHHHLVCTGCGDIEDISDCNISALEKDIAKKKKFIVTTHSLEFFGLCSNCQKK